MTILTNIIQKVSDRLTKELFIDSYQKKNKSFKITFFSILCLAGSLYGGFTISESERGMMFIYLFFTMLGFFSALINAGNFLDNYNMYKIVVKNKVSDLNYEHSRKELNSEEINELFNLDLPDYVVEQLYEKIEWGSITYNDLQKMDLLLVRGEEHYINNKEKEAKSTRLQFKKFISKNKLSDKSSENVNRILALRMKDKQHTKTFNSKKVL